MQLTATKHEHLGLGQMQKIMAPLNHTNGKVTIAVCNDSNMVLQYSESDGCWSMVELSLRFDPGFPDRDPEACIINVRCIMDGECPKMDNCNTVIGLIEDADEAVIYSHSARNYYVAGFENGQYAPAIEIFTID